jgi:hypothetical protein
MANSYQEGIITILHYGIKAKEAKNASMRPIRETAPKD